MCHTSTFISFRCTKESVPNLKVKIYKNATHEQLCSFSFPILFSPEKKLTAGLKTSVMHVLFNAEKVRVFLGGKFFILQVLQIVSPGLLMLVYFEVSFKNKGSFPFLLSRL